MDNNSYERYAKIRDLRGLTDYKVTKLSGIKGTATISNWKNGKYTPKDNKMQEIAEILEVPLDYLKGIDSKIRCKECGQIYDLLDPLEKSVHDNYHLKLIEAKQKYPFILGDYLENTIAEMDGINNFRNPSLPDEERISSLDRYLQAKFTDYISRDGYNIEGVDFEEFCKSEVSQIESDEVVSNELLTKVAEKYRVDISMLDMNSRLLARASNNQQLMRLLAYAEKLTPEMLNMLEIQAKALSEQNPEE